jgi:type II secretory pathway component GspD/PulD (secretin)
VQPGAAPGKTPCRTHVTIPLAHADVIPNVGADGFTISLTVIDCHRVPGRQPAEDGKVRVGRYTCAYRDPAPRFRVRQMVTQARVYDGQTLVLGGYPSRRPA